MIIYYNQGASDLLKRIWRVLSRFVPSGPIPWILHNIHTRHSRRCWVARPHCTWLQLAVIPKSLLGCWPSRRADNGGSQLFDATYAYICSGVEFG